MKAKKEDQLQQPTDKAGNPNRKVNRETPQIEEATGNKLSEPGNRNQQVRGENKPGERSREQEGPGNTEKYKGTKSEENAQEEDEQREEPDDKEV